MRSRCSGSASTKRAEAHARVPRSLAAAERGDDIRSGQPVTVGAWVTIGLTPVQVLGTAVEWTSRAVLVFWTGGDG